MTTAKEKIIMKLVRQGLCGKCGKRREPNMALARRCWKCNAYRPHQLSSDEIAAIPLPYAGVRPCAVCKTKFQSDNTRSVTRCDKCREYQFQKADLYASEDSIYA